MFDFQSIKSIIFYNSHSPLIFTQLYFWIFFFFVLLGYLLVYKKIAVRNSYLLIVSLFFYYKTSQFYVFLLVFSSLSDFVLGKMIYNTNRVRLRKLLLGVSIFINLFMLVYFKFAYFFTDVYNQLVANSWAGENVSVFNVFAFASNTVAGTSFDVNKIILPVGISFFTFQTISYSIDLYRRKIKPVNSVFDFAFYVSFFPQLVAGPIVRASEFIPQLYKPYKLNRYEFGYALFFILKGLFKKLFIGDYIAVNFIDRVFENPNMFTGFENLMALYAYSLQVYVDFSGYTDVAIGVALLMGFRLPKNFNSPYKAKNVGEFWKRWHMSLSSWLKDYLYIPLGGNKRGSLGSVLGILILGGVIALLALKVWVLAIIMGFFLTLWILIKVSSSFKRVVYTNINLIITMLLGGLWHGASWQFLIWGGLNGLGLIFYKFWRKISPYERFNSKLAIAFKIFITFNFITLTRVWFRANTIESTSDIINQIFSNFSSYLIVDIIMSYKAVFAMLVFGFILHWLPEKVKNKIKKKFILAPIYIQAVVAVIVTFVIYQSLSSDLQPFIYFQF